VELQKHIKTTSIVVTHDLICAKIVANTAIVLKDAKIKFEGEIKNLQSSEDRFLKNFFSGEIVDANS
jgi:phospholipid/cholesterol/gamma-HCH transport system ATP-binding protein